MCVCVCVCAGGVRVPALAEAFAAPTFFLVLGKCGDEGKVMCKVKCTCKVKGWCVCAFIASRCVERVCP